MIDVEIADAIREAAEAAWQKIGSNPNRLTELSDYDLLSLATQAKAAAPVFEAMLVSRCGGIDAANVVLQHVGALSQGKLIKLVRMANIARIAGRTLSENQIAAMFIDQTTGVGAVTVEQERRAALRAGAMN